MTRLIQVMSFFRPKISQIIRYYSSRTINDGSSAFRKGIMNENENDTFVSPQEQKQIKLEYRDKDKKTWKKCTPSKMLNKNCERICLPGCQPALFREKCTRRRRPWDCEKNLPPFPSFSECRRPKPKPLPPNECFCLQNRKRICPKPKVL